MLNSPFDNIGLNLELEQAFVLVLENILRPSVVTHYDRKTVAHNIRSVITVSGWPSRLPRGGLWHISLNAL